MPYSDCTAISEAIARLYDGLDPCTTGAGIVGGHLHIVLDDGNVRDSDVAFCRENAAKDNCEPCLRLADLIASLTPAKRLSVTRARHA